MSTPLLLFLDQQNDAHADWVEAECRRRDVAYFRWCTETFPVSTALSVKIQHGEVGGIIRTSDQEVSLAAITGVWNRRPGEIKAHPGMDERFERFAVMELYETFDGLAHLLWDRRWVSPLHAVRAANHKMSQLRIAHHFGFKTVPTLVTNDPKEVQAFFEFCDKRMIYKTLRQVAISYENDSAYGVYTTLIEEADLLRHLESVQYIPCLFQQFIPKQYELRVNVIGNYVWATAIDTQFRTDTEIDFRPFTQECPHRPVLLPANVELACLRLTHHLGLRMSNIDLIVTPEDDYIFLEVNPNGQWMWIEDLVGYPLCTALVDELVGVDTLANHPYLKQRSLIFEPNTAYKALPA